MPQKHKVLYTPAAVDDMDEIFSYISKNNIVAAEALLDRINEGISNLSTFSNMGSVLSEDQYPMIHRGYRFIVVHPYLIFYRLIDQSVVIHRILHSRRDYLRELFPPEDC